MKKLKFYIDTSVLGGLFDTEDTKRVDTAERLFQLIKDGVYEGYISRLTVEEILKAPNKINEELKNKVSETGFKVLEGTEETINLSNAYVKDGTIPEKNRNDARHIAIGVFHELDFIVSWNYKHMVNIAVRRLINSTNLRMGYNPIEIISPEEVTGDGEMEV
jgi:predicted nucleic acid-binding protein